MPKRVHDPSGAEEKSEDYHGGGRFERVSPDITDAAKVATGVKSANLYLTFEEALKLALQSCLLSLNRSNRGTKAGEEMGVELSIKTGNQRINVNERSIKPRIAAREEDGGIIGLTSRRTPHNPALATGRAHLQNRRRRRIGGVVAR